MEAEADAKVEVPGREVKNVQVPVVVNEMAPENVTATLVQMQQTHHQQHQH